MFKEFIENLRKYGSQDTLPEGEVRNTSTYTLPSGVKYSKAYGDYSDEDAAVALFSFTDNTGDRRYGHLIVPKESLYSHDLDNSKPIQVVGSELDDGSSFNFEDTMRLLSQVTKKQPPALEKNAFRIEIPTGSAIDGSLKKYFGVNDLRDAYTISKRVRDEATKQAVNYRPYKSRLSPNVTNINIP